jgi:hypothetical protein
LKTPGVRASVARSADLRAQKDAWQQELAAEQRNADKPIHPARLLNEISRVAPKTPCSSRTSAGTRTAPGNSS